MNCLKLGFEQHLKQTVKSPKRSLPNLASVFIWARYISLISPQGESLLRAGNYVTSGANGIFVPGVNKVEEIEILAASIDAPLNVMSLPNLTDVASLNHLGVKRFSIGNALSDATTCFIEEKAHSLLTQQNTASLYDNNPVKTTFK